jgi:hypothetical protein
VCPNQHFVNDETEVGDVTNLEMIIVTCQGLKARRAGSGDLHALKVVRGGARSHGAARGGLQHEQQSTLSENTQMLHAKPNRVVSRQREYNVAHKITKEETHSLCGVCHDGKLCKCVAQWLFPAKIKEQGM